MFYFLSFLQDGEFVENLAQEFTDLRRDITIRILSLENQFETSGDVEMSSEEDNSPLPPISVHSSIQVKLDRLFTHFVLYLVILFLK